jgi:hypothetical protein
MDRSRIGRRGIRRRAPLGLERCEPRLAMAAWLSEPPVLPRVELDTSRVVDFWVDPATGSDSGSGASRDAALRTLAEAWRRVPMHAELSVGYRINLAAGVYPESAVPNYWEGRRGTASAPVIVRAADGAGTARLPAVNVFDCHHLAFEGLEISAGGGDVLHFERCSRILLRDTIVRGTGDLASYAAPQEALKVNQSQHVFIENCDISGGWDNAVDFVAVQYGHVVGSRIHRSGDWAMYAKGGSASLTIMANEFFDAGTGGFTAGQGTGFEFMVSPWLTYEAESIRFTHNLVHDVEGAGFGVNGGRDVLFAHNTLSRVGSRSHVIEAVHGLRSCDGDAVTCGRFLAAGGWGTAVPGREEPIPNRDVFVFNNVVFNPDGAGSRWEHLAVAAPRTPSPGSNIPSPARADDGLLFRGNVIWNGPTGHSLGVEGALAADILAHNAINSLRPILVSPATGDYRFAPGFALPVTWELPTIPGFDGSPPPEPPAGPEPPGGPAEPPAGPVSPRVLAVVLPPAGRFVRGERLVFEVVMSEAVTVRGRPRIMLTIGRVRRQATFVSGSGTDRLTFAYRIARGDRDGDGIAIASRIGLPGRASIRTLGGTPILTALAGLDASGIVVDGRARRPMAPW